MKGLVLMQQFETIEEVLQAILEQCTDKEDKYSIEVNFPVHLYTEGEETVSQFMHQQFDAFDGWYAYARSFYNYSSHIYLLIY